MRFAGRAFVPARHDAECSLSLLALASARPEARATLARVQEAADVPAQLALDVRNRLARVDGRKGKLPRQRVVLSDEVRLIVTKRVEHVAAEREVHAGFPVVHALAAEHARDQRVHVDAQVEDQVGHEREAEEASRPRRVGAHHGVARECRVHVTVGQHDEPRLHRRNDLVFQAIGKVGRVEQAEGGDIQLVSRFGFVDGFGEKRRACPAGRHHGVAFDLQPRLQLLDLRRTPDTVRAFDDDQTSFQAAEVLVGEPLSVEASVLHVRSPWPPARCREARAGPCVGPDAVARRSRASRRSP